MDSQMLKRSFLYSAFLLASTSLQAAPVSTGSLVVSASNNIFEYNRSGELIQNFDIVYPGGYTVTEYARDIAVDTNGYLHVYNGTFDPYLSTYRPDTDSWSHTGYSGLDTNNNVSYGGIDVYSPASMPEYSTPFGGSTVFMTDMNAPDQGIVAFNDMGITRFAENISPIDLTVGLDGLLYALSPGGSPGGRNVHIYDPETYSLVNSIDLTSIFGWTEHRSIAVSRSGDLFIADWDGEVHHVSHDGILLDTINPVCDWAGYATSCDFVDIDISMDGAIALGSRFGEVFLTDTSFSSISSFDVVNSSVFVEFAPSPIPVPATVWLFFSGLVAIFTVSRRKHSSN